MRLQSKPGQSIGEYSLITALGITVALSGLFLLGKNLNGIFSAMLPTKSTLSVAQSKPDKSPTASLPSADLPSGMRTLQLANGTTLTLNNYPAALSERLQTLGTNGTTKLMASNIDLLARQLVEAGEITPEQAQGLIDLANEGHAVAEKQRIIEDALTASNYDASSIKDTEYEYTIQNLYYGTPSDRGYPETVEALEKGDFIKAMHILTQPEYSGVKSLLKPFVSTYKQVVASGATSNPAVQSVVAELSASILMLSDSLSEKAKTNSSTSATEFRDMVARDMPFQGILSDTVSATSHQNSKSICTTGKGKDSGKQCM